MQFRRRMSLSLVALPLLAILALPAPARAANYGAVYTPSTAPNTLNLPFQPVETFLDGLTPGKTYTVKIALTNAGSMTWVAGGPNPFRLAYHWSGPAPLYEGARTALPYDVAPGDMITIDATLKTPSVPGTYTLQWDMVHEGVTWFSLQQVPTEDQLVGIGGKVGHDEGRAGDTLYMTEYCKLTDCTGAADESVRNSCLTPHIGFGPGTTQQGASLFISGCGFSGLYKLVLILPLSNMEVPLKIQGVAPGLVSATVPGNFVATDQNAFLMARMNGGKESNKWPLAFKSIRETKQLSSDHVKVIHCSGEADYNYCNDAFAVDQNICCILDTTGQGNPVASFAAISSYHFTDDSAVGDDGTDVYFVELAPGWELSDMKFAIQILNGGGWVGQPQGFMQGANTATIFVPWSVGGNSGVTYYIDFYATGPKGTKP